MARKFEETQIGSTTDRLTKLHGDLCVTAVKYHNHEGGGFVHVKSCGFSLRLTREIIEAAIRDLDWVESKEGAQ